MRTGKSAAVAAVRAARDDAPSAASTGAGAAAAGMLKEGLNSLAPTFILNSTADGRRNNAARHGERRTDGVARARGAAGVSARGREEREEGAVHGKRAALPRGEQGHYARLRTGGAGAAAASGGASDMAAGV